MKHACVAFLLACSCAAGTVHTTAATLPVSLAASSAEHELALGAISCWMGGLWSDALGEHAGAQRERGMVARCSPVLRAVGTTDDRPLRVEDATMVGRIDALIHDRHLKNLLDDVADATRESMHARLAADTVKADADLHPPPGTYTDDKELAALVVGQSHALWELFDASPDRYGPYGAEAHTLGLLVALDRMEIGFRLPKRLKLMVVGPAYAVVFGVSSPVVDGDAAEPLRRGIWLGYLTDVARAAGHPVSANTSNIDAHEALAWTGVEEGFADKLRGEGAYRKDTQLGAVVRGVVARLDDGWDVQERLVATKR